MPFEDGAPERRALGIEVGDLDRITDADAHPAGAGQDAIRSRLEPPAAAAEFLTPLDLVEILAPGPATPC